MRTPSRSVPISVTSFVGRSSEVRDLIGLVRLHTLVTILGPGGIGKSRLALQVAGRFQKVLRGQVHLVELADVEDEDSVSDAICSSLGVSPSGLPRLLATTKILIVLDNCEHVAEAVADFLTPLLRGPIKAKFLLTSRQAILPGLERALNLTTMDVPPSDAGAAALVKYEAASLLVERIRLHTPTFRLDDKNAANLAAICQRMEGMPLAIEIAASRLRSFSPKDLEERLAQDSNALAYAELHGALRHPSMAKAINWSFENLDEDEQIFVLRLASFAGSFTLESGQLVCDFGDTAPTEDVLERLVDKSMLQLHQTSDGEYRYKILAPIREFLRENAPDNQGVMARMRTWACDLVGNLQEDLLGPNCDTAIRLLDAELPNLRLAFDNALASSPAEALQLALRLKLYWIRGRFGAEGRRWLQRALEFAEPADEELAEVQNLIGAIGLIFQEGDAAYPHLVRALELYEGLGQVERAVGVKHNLAIALSAQQNYEAAEGLLQDCVDMLRMLGDDRHLLTGLCNLGNFYRIRETRLAIPYLTEGIALARQIQDRWQLGMALVLLAWTQAHLGQFRESRKRLQEFFALGGERDNYRYSIALSTAAELAHASGDDLLAIRCLYANAQTAGDSSSNRQQGKDGTRNRRLLGTLSKSMGPESRVLRQLVKSQGVEPVISEMEMWISSEVF